MKENEEITNLERFELLIEDCKGHRELYGEFSVGEYDIEIMQHILSDYKRVLKENEELKDFKKQVTDIESTNFIKYKNYIPIQKVKDKIEELKQEKKKYGNCLIEMYEDELVNRDIKILQELLESEK